MAAALECWSGRPSTDEDMVEQVLMKPHSSSSSPLHPLPPPPPTTKWHRLTRNLAASISSALKSSPSPPSPIWSSLLRSLSHLYSGSQLPDRLLSSLRRHFDSLPHSYAQAGYDMQEVLLHARLIEQAAAEDHPAVDLAAASETPAAAAIYRLTFASTSPLSWPAMSCALDASLIICRKIQIFEKKGLTLGVVALVVPVGVADRHFQPRIEAALRGAVRAPARNAGVKLSFGLCGRQDEGGNRVDDDGTAGGGPEIHLPAVLPESSLVVSVDEWQTVRSGGEDIARWLLNPDDIEYADRNGATSFKGVYRGKKVWIKKLKGCDRGSAYDVEVRQDLLQLMSCGHRNILQLHGICIDENQGMCVVSRMMDGGSVHDLMERSRKVPVREVVRIALGAAEGLRFMNDHGVAYRDLNVQRILLDRQGNACLGDMGAVTSNNNAGEVTEYETAGYRWLAPEIIAGDPESVTETWMSNVYSFGMVVWEMITGEAAYSSYSPVQAAVGIAACGLRPEIAKDCPQVLRSLMLRCWNNCPAKRPQFSDIIAILQRYDSR